MLGKFNEFIEEKKLCNSTDKILLAISGGIDSMVLSHLFLAAKYKISLAHCNFQLRGEESDADQQFIEEFALNNNLKLHTKKFDTKAYFEELGISTQMGARELRYRWFRELIFKNGYNCIAIAHNRNDVAETMLLNLIRGTGLKGLTGIKVKNQDIIRPLLFASRNDIEQYAKANSIPYREDSSNAETKYQRNLIRHNLLPEMENINPSVIDTLYQEASVFQSTYKVYAKEIKKWRDTITEKADNQVKISIQKLISLVIQPEQFFDLIAPYGFTLSDSANILESLQGESGKQFYAENYVLLKDRDYLIIESKSVIQDDKLYRIPAEIEIITNPVHLSFEKLNLTGNFKIPDPKQAIALDYDKLGYPLELRHWHDGDFFVPLGMTGRKKISDFFIDQKINLLEKKRIWLLVSNENIVAVLGYQIDDRFKISAETKTILLVNYH